MNVALAARMTSRTVKLQRPVPDHRVQSLPMGLTASVSQGSVTRYFVVERGYHPGITGKNKVVFTRVAAISGEYISQVKMDNSPDAVLVLTDL